MEIQFFTIHCTFRTHFMICQVFISLTRIFFNASIPRDDHSESAPFLVSCKRKIKIFKNDEFHQGVERKLLRSDAKATILLIEEESATVCTNFGRE